MLRVFPRRVAVGLAGLLALGAAPLLPAAHAGAAVADSTASIDDKAKDVTLRDAKSPVDEPRADILAATARAQNDFINLTMKLAKGDDLSAAKPDDYLRWGIGLPPEGGLPAFVVDLKKGANGFGQAIVAVPGNEANPIKCDGAIASFDATNALYLASIPAKCVGSPASVTWNAQRGVTMTGTGGASDVAVDLAPDTAAAKALTPTPVVGYWAIGSDGKVYNFGDAPKLGEPTSSSIIDI
ncbi:MAG: hypothetical protein QOI86_2458, partial [Actinomycetota bacterium]|nr:hypothetical protein [Actinomycetota bacterium]